MSIKTIITKVKEEIETPEVQIKGSNLIEPTEAMVKDVIQRYVNGEDIGTIKKQVKKKGTNLTLSFEQIKQIITEYQIQTTPEPEPVEEIKDE